MGIEQENNSGDSFEQLQDLFNEMFQGDPTAFPPSSSSTFTSSCSFVFDTNGQQSPFETSSMMGRSDPFGFDSRSHTFSLGVTTIKTIFSLHHALGDTVVDDEFWVMCRWNISRISRKGRRTMVEEEADGRTILKRLTTMESPPLHRPFFSEPYFFDLSTSHTLTHKRTTGSGPSQRRCPSQKKFLKYIFSKLLFFFLSLIVVS